MSAFSDSFDAYTTSITGWDSVGGSATLSTSTRTGQGKSLFTASAGSYVVAKWTLPTQVSRTYGFYAKLNALPSGTTYLAALTSNSQFSVGSYLRVSPTGQIIATASDISNVFGTSAAGVIKANQWQFIEIQATHGSTTGAVTVRVDGADVLTASNVNANTGGAGFAGLMLYGYLGPMSFDDVYINDGLVWNGAPETRVDVSFPIAAGLQTSVNVPAPYRDAVLADGPVGYWRMDDASGTVMRDATSNARNGSYVGSPNLTAPTLLPTGGGGLAFGLDGVDDRGVIAHNTAFEMSAGGFTIEMWVKLTNPSSDAAQVLIDKTGTSTTNGQWSIYWDNRSSQGTPQRLRFINGDAIVDWAGSAALNSLAAGGHLVCTYGGTGNQARIYWNGVQVGAAGWGNRGSNGRQIDIGCVNGGALPLTGTIDELALYATALTGSQISAHYAAATTAPAPPAPTVSVSLPIAVGLSSATVVPPPTFTGSVAATLPALGGSVSGAASAPVYTGAVGATLPALSATVTGTHVSNNQIGTVAATLPALSAAVDGSVTVPPVDGTTTATLPALTGMVAGDVALQGSVAATLPALQAAVNDGSGDATGTVAAALPALTGGLVGAVSNGVGVNDPDDTTVIIVDTDEGELDFFPPLAIPPAGFVGRPLIRRSVIVPALDTIPGAIKDPATGELRIPDHIYDALPLAAPVQEVGSLRVLMAEAGDVTFFRDGIAQPISDRSEEPFGDSTAQLEIPRLTSMDEEPDAPSHPLWWTSNRANVEFVLKRPDGTITRLWSGLAVSDDTGNDDAPVWRKDLVGSLWQAAYTVHQVPNMLDPTDIGSLVPAALNAVTSRRYPKIPNVTTGIMSRQRGSWSDSQMAHAQNLLATAWTSGGNQWTVAKVPNTKWSYEMRLKKTTPEWTVTNGARGVKVSLSQDLTQGRNVIYGRGVGPDGYAWLNTKYPNLRPDSAPLFTGPVLGLGASGPKVVEWQTRVKDLGYSIAVDGVISSSDVSIIETVQRRYGLQVDGVIGPQTWAATFDVGANGADLSGVIRLPLAAHPSTQRFLYNADGSVAGENPDYDWQALVIEDDIDFGSGVSRAEGIASAQQIVDRESTPALSGTITLETDPREGSRMLIPVGDKITLVGFRGQDRVLHIVARERDWQNLTVTLTVDERARDAMTVAQIHARNKESRRDPARRPGNVNRRSRLDADQVVPFDGESGAGRVPKFATYGGLWSVIRIPVSETGRVAIVDLQTSGPTSQLYAAMFGAPIQPAHLVKYVGNPSSSSAKWEQNRAVLEDQFGWIEGFGSPDEPGGYWPGLKSNNSPLTGRLKDTGGFEYVSAKPPWIWVAVYTPVSSYVSGRILPAPVI